MKKSIIAVLVLLTLSGCSRNVTSEAIENAIKICEDNDGLSSIWVGTFEHNIYCNDTAIFNNRKNKQ